MLEPRKGPTVAANLRWHERQINRLGTAPMGPVSLGPGEGSLTVTDATGAVLMDLASTAVRVPFAGSLTSISSALDQVDAAVKKEVTDRKDYDALVVQKINTDVQGLKDYDALVVQKINTDVQGLKDYDALIVQKINTDMTAERDARNAQVGSLWDGISQETSTRVAQDKALSDYDKVIVQKINTDVAAERDARVSGDASTLSSAKTAAQGYANTAEANAKTAAQGYANTAESNAEWTALGYANGAEARAKAHADAGDTDLANNQIAPLIAKLNGLDTRVSRLESGGGSTL